MFTPISLYRLDPSSRGTFLDSLVGSFGWFVFLFQGSPPHRWFGESDLALLGEHGGAEIALVDFSPTSNNMREYLYGRWAEHCPAGVPEDLVRMMQRTHEEGLDEEDRAALERVFYSCLFRGDSFQPSVAVANVKRGFLVRRKLGPPQPEFSGDSLLQLLDRLHSGDLDGLGAEQLGKNLLGYEERFYKPRNANSQSLVAAFADFYDAADDALDALRHAEVEPLHQLEALGLATTTRFNRAFSSLDEDLQHQTLAALRQFRDDPSHPGLRLEKISVTKTISLWRLRVTQSCRVHFRRSVQDPLLDNVGKHRLFEHGYAIG